MLILLASTLFEPYKKRRRGCFLLVHSFFLINLYSRILFCLLPRYLSIFVCGHVCAHIHLQALIIKHPVHNLVTKDTSGPVHSSLFQNQVPVEPVGCKFLSDLIYTWCVHPHTAHTHNSNQFRTKFYRKSFKCLHSCISRRCFGSPFLFQHSRRQDRICRPTEAFVLI